MEWKLFEGDDPPACHPAFFAEHPWTDPADQVGHAERSALVAKLVHYAMDHRKVDTIVDLGCGDGSLLTSLADTGRTCWGYEIGKANLERAHAAGLDVRCADLLADELDEADLAICSEVLEHLADPYDFLRHGIPAGVLVASSPFNESDEWHYIDHAWAWDIAGYHDLLTRTGWTVLRGDVCFSDNEYDHGTGDFRPLGFQGVLAVRS